jgi:hypothetical protein
MWSSDAGMPEKYCKKASRVATSRHTLVADATLFRVPKAERVGARWILLAPGVRVRQGRGTSLVVEHQTDRGRWAQ